jgi:CheY-like chemotaxis protein
MKPKILIIDDSSDIQEAMDALCEAWGYDSFAARTESQALEMLALHPDIAVVFMDGNLVSSEVPKLDTEGLVREIRVKYPNLKLIAHSGTPEWNTALMNAGCHRRIEKPVRRISEMKDAIESLLSLSAAPVAA